MLICSEDFFDASWDFIYESLTKPQLHIRHWTLGPAEDSSIAADVGASGRRVLPHGLEVRKLGRDAAVCRMLG